jgi:hypothetical protein
MLDGAELALALAEEPDIDAAVRRYETPMFPRSARAAAFAATGIERAIADDSPAHSLAMMTALAEGLSPFAESA